MTREALGVLTLKLVHHFKGDTFDITEARRIIQSADSSLTEGFRTAIIDEALYLWRKIRERG